MLDRERILAKLDELDSYLRELAEVSPKTYEEYIGSTEKKRACERLLHISVECTIDICSIIAANKKLGLPGSEEDMFKKLEDRAIISEDIAKKLRVMRGFRNILVHRYGSVDDELVYEVLKNNIEDLRDFKVEILKLLREEGEQ